MSGPRTKSWYSAATRIIEQATGADHETAARALKDSGNRTPVAVVMLAAGVTRSKAVAALKKIKATSARQSSMRGRERHSGAFGRLRFNRAQIFLDFLLARVIRPSCGCSAEQDVFHIGFAPRSTRSFTTSRCPFPAA